MSNQQDTKKKNPNVPTLRFGIGGQKRPLRDVVVFPKSTASCPKNIYISTENLKQDFQGFVAYQDNSLSKGISFKEGDTLFANIRPYLKKAFLASFNGCCSPDVICFRPAGILPGYLYYAIANEHFTDHVMEACKGSKMPRGDRSWMLQKEIFVPSEEEQMKVVSFLRLIDQRIETQNKIIEEQISLEKAIKSMGIYSVSHDTIPLSSVFEVVKEKAGASIKATVYTASAKYGLVDEERFFKKKISSDNTENYTVIRNGDYVFSKSSSRDAPYGAFLAFEGKIGLVSPLYFVLRPRKKLSNVTIESWFSSSHCQKQMGAITQEGARSHGMLNISLKDFLSLRLWQSIPSQYEKVFTAMKLKREIEECLLELLMKQKQFLLQEMFI